MGRLRARRALLWAGLLLALVGCAGPRFVSIDANGGCVAVPDDSDGWPYYYHTSAEKLIRDKCPNGYRILKEEEVVVGKHTTTNAQRNTKNNQQTETDTTEVRDRTEWRIWFEKKK